MVYVEQLQSPSVVQMSSRIGMAVSLRFWWIGNAFMAAMTYEAAGMLLRRLPLPWPAHTANTLVERVQFRRHLALIHERGWLTHREEQEIVIFCSGAVIIGAKAQSIRTVSVSTLGFARKTIL